MTGSGVGPATPSDPGPRCGPDVLPGGHVLPAMLSYAQNGEDVVLRRVFRAVTDGFYVDIGACVPVEDSVTMHFYEHGWHGVNVEPDPRFAAELSAVRTRDVNLQAAVGSGRDAVRFFPTVVRGQGTLDDGVAADRGGDDSFDVPQLTLSEVLERHAPRGGVDFLKVDVEGWEAAVLSSHDWSGVRPRVVVVEAVEADGTPNHESWEPSLLAAGYVFGLFDGLNRFYCAQEEAARLRPEDWAPANVLDNFRLHREVQVQRELERRLDATQARVDSLQQALEEATAALDCARRAADEAVVQLSEESRQHLATKAVLSSSEAAGRSALERERRGRSEAEVALAATQEVVQGMRASSSWRITAPLRAASRLGKVLRPGGSA